MTSINHQIRLAARPAGVPTPSDWKLTTEPVPDPGPGEFVVGVEYLSVDPAMLTWINATSSVVEPIAIDGVMDTAAVGRVIASNMLGSESATMSMAPSGFKSSRGPTVTV
jgi:NADPH-dependent curcumin reductase CurA